MRKFFGIALSLLALSLVALALLVTGWALHDRATDYEVDLGGAIVPHYDASEIDFDQGNDFSVSLPFMGSAIIDVDGDGVEELFLGGGRGHVDGLFTFGDGRLRAVPGTAGITKGDAASFGATALDVDADGDCDLLVAREDGIWLHRNTQGAFDSVLLQAEMPDGTTPLSIAVADLNRDGAFDMFVSGYIRNDLVEGQNIFNKEGYGGSSRLFINRGDDTFEDATESAGLVYKHNTFQSVFIDIDRDGSEDLLVIHDTGQVRTWRNDGTGRFELRPNPTSEQFTYPMGIAVTDLGNDGLADFFFSNVGSTPPDFLVRGDLTADQVSNWKWILFKNHGDFNFTDIAQEAKVADYEFSWGAVFEDLNLDGLEDLIVAENYIGFPTHRFEALRLDGRVLLQTPSGEFAAVEREAGVINRAFSISPLTADFNDDGYPDIVHANLNGPSKLFLSRGGGNGYLKVALPQEVRSIGAYVRVTLTDDSVIARPYVSGEGLCSDSSRVIIVGLGEASARKVEVHFLDGDHVEQAGAFRNQLVSF